MRPAECSLELHHVIQAASTPTVTSGPLAIFQSDVSSLFLSGTYALANGYLLSAIIFSSMLVHIIDGKFGTAAVWLYLAAAAASTGIIDARYLDPFHADQLFTAMYALASLPLLMCHVL